MDLYNLYQKFPVVEEQEFVVEWEDIYMLTSNTTGINNRIKYIKYIKINGTVYLNMIDIMRYSNWFSDDYINHNVISDSDYIAVVYDNEQYEQRPHIFVNAELLKNKAIISFRDHQFNETLYKDDSELFFNVIIDKLKTFDADSIEFDNEMLKETPEYYREWNSAVHCESE